VVLGQSFVRNRATWLSYLMLAFYSYFLNIFGPITPFLKNELNLSYTVSSLHFSAFALGLIGAGLAGSAVITRIGRRNALWIGALGVGAGALLLIVGRDPTVTIGASFFMGLVGSLILAIVPPILSDQHGEKRAVALSEANVIASLVSSTAPILVGLLALTSLGWRAALGIAIVIGLIMRIVFNAVTLPASKSPSRAEQPQPRLSARYWIYWIALVVSVSAEFCMIFWSADYLETRVGMPKAEAAQAVSLFLGGMIIGRLVSSRLVQRFTIHSVISGALIIAAVGFLIYWTASTPASGVLGLFLTGLGISCLYPLILSLAIGSTSGSTDRASTLSLIASGVAIFTLPLILGRLADLTGIHSAYIVVLVLLVIVFGLIQLMSLNRMKA
jgi:fucose permease